VRIGGTEEKMPALLKEEKFISQLPSFKPIKTTILILIG
jgi:hypothetical protein